MLRRTLHRNVKLVIVESPNKVYKIQTFLTNTPDWTFGQAALKPVCPASNERVEVIATVGHFLELSNVQFNRLPIPAKSTGTNATATDSAVPSAETGDDKKKKKKSKKAPAKEALSASYASFTGDKIYRGHTLQWVPSKDKNTATEIVQKVLSMKKELSEIILASDPDREGELISKHVFDVIQRDVPNLKVRFSRAYIHSITPEGVQKALAERRIDFLDVGLAQAAETRHAMDRYFGYLGSNVVRHLNQNLRSVGRVQTPALITIAQRENQIEKYMKEHRATFSLQAECTFGTKGGTQFKKNVVLQEIKSGKEAKAVAAVPAIPKDKLEDTAAVEAHDQRVKEVYVEALDLGRIGAPTASPPTYSTIKTSPPKLFTMATLITRANRDLKMTSEQVARGLQDLFQNGAITYPRTDSTRIDPSVLPEVYKYITNTFGAECVYTLEAQEQVPNTVKGKKKAQAAEEGNAEDAHEAIRPTHIHAIHAANVDNHAAQLYTIIRLNTLAAFMVPHTQEKVQTEVSFSSGSDARLLVKLEARRVTQVGFQAAFKGTQSTGAADGEAEGNVFETTTPPEFEAVEKLGTSLSAGSSTFVLGKVAVTKSRPQPPPQYSEGTLIEMLKENGVGRPSTYPSLCKTLLTRGYVVHNAKGRLETTALGRTLVTNATICFPKVVDIGFTAQFEKKLDLVATAGDGSQTLHNIALSEFLNEFLEMIEVAGRSNRYYILERMTRLRLGKDASAEALRTEVDRSAATFRFIKIHELMKSSPDFLDTQRKLDGYLRSDFPAVAR